MKKLLILFVGLAISVAIFSGCMPGQKENNPDRKTVTVQRRNIKSVANISGVVRADPEIVIIAKSFGEVTKTYAKEGDTVKKGDKIYDITVENIVSGYRTTFKETITSPIDGTILKLDYIEGDTVLRGAPLATIGDTNHFVVDAYADEIDVVNIKKDQQATISFDAFPYKSVKGKVSYVALTTTLTKQGVQAYKVKVSFANSGLDLKDGLSATVYITTAEKNNVLTVPIESVATENGRSYVMLVLPDGKVEKHFVKIGISSDNYTEIISGLKEGDTILEIPDQYIFKDINVKVPNGNSNGG